MVLIIHPASRRRYPARFEKLLHDLRAAAMDFDRIETRDAEDAVVQTRAALETGYLTIVSLGGDGMLRFCVQGFMKNRKNNFPDRRLLALPFGTGNDFFKGFIPIEKQRDLAWVSGFVAEQPVSLGCFQSEDGQERYFINSFSVGMTTDIIRDYSRSRWRSYFWSTLRVLWYFRPVALKVKLSGAWQVKKSLLLIVSKGPFVGGGMRFHREADHLTGKGKIIWVPRLGFSWVFMNLWKLYRGGVEAMKGVESFDFQEFSLDFGPGEHWVEADGELYQVKGRVSVHVLPASIRMLRPGV